MKELNFKDYDISKIESEALMMHLSVDESFKRMVKNDRLIQVMQKLSGDYPYMPYQEIQNMAQRIIEFSKLPFED